MDVQLQELIDKIKKDGVVSAEEAASEIISKAEKKAAEIVKEAESKAEGIINTAKSETQRMEKASEDAIKQAGRNILISLRKSVEDEFTALIESEVADAYKKDMLVKLIPEAVTAWCKNTDAADVSVLLSEKDLPEMEKNLKAALKANLKMDKSLADGFRIEVGNAFYDFSSEGVAALFSAYLNPRTAAIMKEAVK